MNYVFISGISTAGKSYLAKRVAKETGSTHISTDDLKEKMAEDSKLEPFVNFFWNMDENKYWENISPEEHWNNLKKQSEAFWPTVLEKIYEIKKTKQSAIFEGVNILPHLAHRDLDFSGIILLGESEEVVFKRYRENPRWGQTYDLQKKEAEWSFVYEGKNYAEESSKYGYKTFHDTEKAEKKLIELLKK